MQTARLSISAENPVRNILERQAPAGYWQIAKHYYSPKYRASHWSMLLLSELGMDPHHTAMQNGMTFMQDSFEDDQRLMKSEAPYWGCLWGNALRYQLYCGNPHEAFIQSMLEYVVRDLQQLSRCQYNNGLPCAWGVVRDLYGLALLPAEKRSAQVNQAIQAGLKFMLEDYDLLAADYPHIEKVHPTWSKLSFPLFYQSDMLLVLRVAKELNARQTPQAMRGLAWLETQRNKNGNYPEMIARLYGGVIDADLSLVDRPLYLGSRKIEIPGGEIEIQTNSPLTFSNGITMDCFFSPCHDLLS